MFDPASIKMANNAYERNVPKAISHTILHNERLTGFQIIISQLNPLTAS